jgi:hypothetical protein
MLREEIFQYRKDITMATLGLGGTMGLDFKALLNKGKTQLADAAKKEALKVAQKELDKYAPKKAAETPAQTIENLVAASGMSKTWLIVGGVSLVAVIGILLMSGKKKPKKAQAEAEAV